MMIMMSVLQKISSKILYDKVDFSSKTPYYMPGNKTEIKLKMDLVPSQNRWVVNNWI